MLRNRASEQQALVDELVACDARTDARMQWLLRSDTLQAMFQYGAPEALAFMALLVPFAAAMSALIAAIWSSCSVVKPAAWLPVKT